jgi:hypothetical protein
MLLSVVSPPFKATFPSNSKVSAHFRAMLMVLAAACFCVIPDTGPIQPTIDRRSVVVDVVEQFLL